MVELTDIVDISVLRTLYSQIVDILGSETPMEKLNNLIHQRFYVVPAMTAYAQGVTDDLLHALKYRDIETRRQVLQFILEYRLPVTSSGD